MGDVVLYLDELQSRSAISHCRICHEAEFESCKSLEAPCACSGTVKFAHRDCIQRWCNEKGNTTCEICLQNYEPGYTATEPLKKCQLIDTMTIRDSLEIPSGGGGGGGEPQDPESFTGDGDGSTIHSECTDAADRIASCFRSLALTFAVFMLFRHLFATLTGGSEDYPFTILTILILRVSGILLPMYIIFWTIGAIHKSVQQQYQHYQDTYNDDDISTFDEVEDEQQHLV